MQPIITLLTDFGTSDGFVGAMKGVILSLAPGAQVVDLTHEIAPQDVLSGAWALREAATTFPPGTIHVAVVDPGVGTDRRPILVEHGGQLFVGPDNGVLSLAAPDGQAWHLDRPNLFRGRVSQTFHGRDVFAPVAGHLAAGLSPDACGSAIETWLRWPEPRPTRTQGRISGQVVHADRFGNLVTNICHDDLGAERQAWVVEVGGQSIGLLSSTFGDVERGEWVAYIGSSGYLEIGIREGRASSTHAAGTVTILSRNRKITR